MTLTDPRVRASRGHTESTGRRVRGRLRAKIRLEVLVDDAQAEDVVDTIVRTAATGKIGDARLGRPGRHGVRVRTGDGFGRL